MNPLVADDTLVSSWVSSRFPCQEITSERGVDISTAEFLRRVRTALFERRGAYSPPLGNTDKYAMRLVKSSEVDDSIP